MVNNDIMKKEQERMDYVVSVIKEEAVRLDEEYGQKLVHQKRLLKESSNIRINTSSNEAMWESSGELREFEQDLTIKSNELVLVKTRIAVLGKMQEDPYFGRIDYHTVKDAFDEQIYVGIGSLFDEEDNLIVDWRAPISALYYEGNVGDRVNLRIGETNQTFEVDLKRQFRVKDGEITGMIDTDNVMGDPYLMEVLESSSSNQMGPVIATLQKEQNQIVRETAQRNVLIQGVAGSGKTVVMMQKIAYLLYALRKQLKAEEILLFSPNRIFQAYISQVLPSLGEWDVEGNTFNQFMQRRVANFSVLRNDVGDISSFTNVKGSLEYYHALDRYGRLLKKKYMKFRDLTLHDEVLISSDEITEMYEAIESKGSLASKLEILRNRLLHRLKEIELTSLDKDWVDEELQHFSRDTIHKFEQQTHDITKIEGFMRREIVAKAFKTVERKINAQSFMRHLSQYLHFMRALPQLMDLDEFGVTSDQWQEHVKDVAEMIRDKKLSLDDMTAFYALQLQLKGMLKQKSYQYICIDEVQDFTPFQLRLLKALYPRARYIMAGDLNQNIWQNRTSNAELQEIFNEEEIEKHLLLTSYRSTKEIMAFADQFTSLSERTANPIRSRNKPEVLMTKEAGFSEKLKNRLFERIENGERVAFLAPNLASTKQMVAFLDEWGIDYQEITSDDDFLSGQVVVMPISLAKGLEFDVVVASATDEAYSSVYSENTKQIWYTIFSRAMHQLYVLVSDENAKLLENVVPETYDVVK